MEDSIIVCPHCSGTIKLTEAMAGPIVAKAKQDLAKQVASIKAEADAKVQEAAKATLTQVAAAKKQAQEEATTRLALLHADSDAKVKQDLEDARSLLAENKKSLAEAQKAQAEFMRKERALDDEKRELDLTVEKRIQAGLGAARTQAEDQMKLKVMEKDETIKSMAAKIDELRQKAEQGSQQLQGEVQELDIETKLKEAFPTDLVESVGKGVNGADIKHTVFVSGKPCGVILWESKRTKNWNDEWLTKLKVDMRAAGADIPALVSQALPKGLHMVDIVDGVCVSDYRYFMAAATLLRAQLIEVVRARVASEGLKTKAELVYDYLTGKQFKRAIEVFVETFKTMHEDLEKEVKVISKQWAKRREQITQVSAVTIGMYGELQAIAGKSLQEIEGLELKSLGSAE